MKCPVTVQNEEMSDAPSNQNSVQSVTASSRLRDKSSELSRTQTPLRCVVVTTVSDYSAGQSFVLINTVMWYFCYCFHRQEIEVKQRIYI